MIWKFQGVKNIISPLFPQALHVYCPSRALNLAIWDATDTQGMWNCVRVMGNIYSVLSTPKNEALWRVISLNTGESNKTKLVKLSPTRGVERHEFVIVMVELRDALCYTLREISTWQDFLQLQRFVRIVFFKLHSLFRCTPYTYLHAVHCWSLIMILYVHKITSLISWRN